MARFMNCGSKTEPNNRGESLRPTADTSRYTPSSLAAICGCWRSSDSCGSFVSIATVPPPDRFGGGGGFIEPQAPGSARGLGDDRTGPRFRGRITSNPEVIRLDEKRPTRAVEELPHVAATRTERRLYILLVPSCIS